MSERMRAEQKGTLPQKYPDEYACWKSMRERERRGTAEVHPEFQSFAGFMRHMKPMPRKGMTVDRLDSANPVYGPKLVRWATKTQQSENRRNTIYLTYEGAQYPEHKNRRLPLTQWAKITKTNPQTLRRRRSEGWTDTEIIDGERRATDKPFERMTYQELRDYQPWEEDRRVEHEAAYGYSYRQYEDRFDFKLRVLLVDAHRRLRERYRNIAYWLHSEEQLSAYLREVPARDRTPGDWGRKLGAPSKGWLSLQKDWEAWKREEGLVREQQLSWRRAMAHAATKERVRTTRKEINSWLDQRYLPRDQDLDD